MNRFSRVAVDGRPCFRKANDARFADALAAEAEGLAALRAAGVRAPEPLALGVEAGEAWLLLEYLELRNDGDWAALGRMLAAQHRYHGEHFGWTRDNYIGATPQANGWLAHWPTFFAERRLAPQLRLARENGFRVEAGNVMELLAQHQPQPSLLHGDLWSGNAGFTREGPVVFDPAVYYGDREADLAMTELFGGFPPQFYEAYRATLPVDPGYEKRKALYNLYHLLNHLNLFGAGYLGQVRAVLRLLLLR